MDRGIVIELNATFRREISLSALSEAAQTRMQCLIIGRIKLNKSSLLTLPGRRLSAIKHFRYYEHCCDPDLGLKILYGGILKSFSVKLGARPTTGDAGAAVAVTCRVGSRGLTSFW